VRARNGTLALRAVFNLYVRFAAVSDGHVRAFSREQRRLTDSAATPFERGVMRSKWFVLLSTAFGAAYFTAASSGCSHGNADESPSSRNGSAAHGTDGAAAVAAAGSDAELVACTDASYPGNPSFTGGTTHTDPLQRGRLEFEPVYDSLKCDAPPAPITLVNAEDTYHFHAYSLKNESGADACLRFDIYYRQCSPSAGEWEPPPDPSLPCSEGGCGGVGAHEANVYLGSFDPNDIRSGYLGGAGRLGAGPGRDLFSVKVAAGATFELVVTWAGPVAPAYDPYYSVYVSGCEGAAPPPPPPPADGGTSSDNDAGTANNGGGTGSDGGKTW
jgi:hypothetical protein